MLDQTRRQSMRASGRRVLPALPARAQSGTARRRLELMPFPPFAEAGAAPRCSTRLQAEIESVCSWVVAQLNRVGKVVAKDAETCQRQLQRDLGGTHRSILGLPHAAFRHPNRRLKGIMHKVSSTLQSISSAVGDPPSPAPARAVSRIETFVSHVYLKGVVKSWITN